jgi:hypothetical protein
MEEYKLESFLNKYANTVVDFFRFNGNYGDLLIWHGTMNLFKNFSINVNYVDINSNIDNEVLFIASGVLVDYYFEYILF